MRSIRDLGKVLSEINSLTLSLQPNLSAKAKLELERKLKALNFHSSEKMIDDVERSNAKKYHMVRHFGKIKLEIVTSNWRDNMI